MKLSIFFWLILSATVLSAATPPPIQYTPMTTNAPAAMTNAVRNIASTLSRDLNANNKNITNVLVVTAAALTASSVIIANNEYLNGTLTAGKIVGTNIYGNGSGLTNVAASATNAESVVIPQQYGAVGNGVADDTIPLLMAAVAADSGPYKTIYFPSGTYRFGAALAVTNNNVRFVGEGNNTVLWCTNPSVNAIEFNANDCGESFNSVQNLVIKGVGTNGCTKAGIYGGAPGVSCGRDGLYIANVRVKQFADGILLSNWVSATLVNVHLTGNRSNAFHNEKGVGNITFINPELGYSVAATSSDMYGYVDPAEGTNSRAILASSGNAGPCTITIIGGEMGNCGKFIEQNGTGFAQVGGNMETFWGRYVYDFSNMTWITIQGPRISTGANDAIIPYHFTGGDMSSVSISGKPYVVRTNILARIDSITPASTGYRRYPMFAFEASGGPQEIQFWYEGTYSTSVTNIAGAVPTLYEYNQWNGQQLFNNNISVSNGIITGDGSGLFNLPSAGISLNPFTSEVHFKNGSQDALVLGADAGVTTVTTNTDKAYYVTAPTWTASPTNSRIGLLNYINLAPTNSYLWLGWAQGFGAIRSISLYAATTNSENTSDVINTAYFNGMGSHFPLPAEFNGRNESTNLYFMLTNTGFISEHNWLTNPVLHVVSPYNSTVTVIYTNGVGDTNTTIVYTNQNTAKIDGNLVIGGGEYSPANATIYGSGFGLTNLNIGNANLFPNAFSGWVTNVAPAGTNRIMYTNGIVWTNIFQ